MSLMQHQVGQWHSERFPTATLEDCYLKLVSEVGELGDAILGTELGGKGEIGPELGDVLITLCAVANHAGYNLIDAFERKFETVRGVS